MPNNGYTEPCRNEDCPSGSNRRKDDVVCKRCYRRLPPNLRRGLWLREGERISDWHGRVVLALNWLHENPED